MHDEITPQHDQPTRHPPCFTPWEAREAGAPSSWTFEDSDRLREIAEEMIACAVVRPKPDEPTSEIPSLYAKDRAGLPPMSYNQKRALERDAWNIIDRNHPRHNRK
jgi:hypothetical protein